MCHIGHDGITLLSLSNLAKKLGFETMNVSIPLSKLVDCTLPIILHWNQNHFVTLYKVDGNKKYHICDPAIGRLKLNENEFIRNWFGDSEKGIALLLEPTEKFGCLERKYEQSLETLDLIKSYFSRYKGFLAQVVLSLCFVCAIQFIFPYLTQNLVDIGIGQKRVGFIGLILLGELFLIVGKVLSEFVRKWLMLHISMRVNVTLISDFFIKLLNLPMSFFESRTIGDLNQRMNDHARVQAFLTNQCLNSIFSVLTFVIFSVILLFYSRLIFFVFMGGSLLYGIWITLFLDKRKKIDYELFDVQADNQSKTYQFLSSVQEIKLQDCKLRRRWEWEDIQADLFEIQQKSMKLQQTQATGSIFINELKNLLITVISAMFVISGNLSLGGMMAIQYIVGQLSNPIEQVVTLIYSLQDMTIALERINQVHNFINENELHGNLHEIIADKDIATSALCFKYNPDSPNYILQNVNINIPKDKVTAIVGHSGSGKTTLLKLLLGFYHNYTGEIFIGKNSLQSYDLEWWRKQCGVVMQEGVIFSESIARNIAVGDEPIDMEKIYQAAKVANILNDIEALPMKFNTIIGKEGQGLSQGQKQRILIARAVYRNPKFIFLDEATNALDAKNEKVIVENLMEFYKKRTVVVVAHRLSTVKRADQIIVLDKGRVVECGSHLELIEKRGAYFALVNNQLE